MRYTSQSVGRFGFTFVYFFLAAVSIASWFALIRVVISINGCIWVVGWISVWVSGGGGFVDCELKSLVRLLDIVRFYIEGRYFCFLTGAFACVSAWL